MKHLKINRGRLIVMKERWGRAMQGAVKIVVCLLLFSLRGNNPINFVLIRIDCYSITK